MVCFRKRYSALTECRCIQFFTRDSRSITAAQSRMPIKRLYTELKYYEVTYTCIHGGEVKSRSAGVREQRYLTVCLSKYYFLALWSLSFSLCLSARGVVLLHHIQYEPEHDISYPFLQLTRLEWKTQHPRSLISRSVVCPFTWVSGRFGRESFRPWVFSAWVVSA